MAAALQRCGGCGEATRVYVERSCAGCGRVSLHDVNDAAAFVHSRINAAHLSLTGDLREQLHAEGMRMLVAMARRYQPGYGGRDAAGSSFAGYAAKFLPGKLGDAWHRQCDHTLVTREGGGREWDIPSRPVSLDAIADDPDGPGLAAISALQARDDPDETVGKLQQVLADWWDERCAQVDEYARLRAEGHRTADIADLMRLLPPQVRELEAFTRELARRIGRISADR